MHVLRRRWWILVLTVVVAVGSAFAYARHQQPRYEATGSIYVASSPDIKTPGERVDELNRLAFGPIVSTVATVTSSPRVLDRTAKSLHMSSNDLSNYNVFATVEPGTTDIYIYVDGPSESLARRVAAELPEQLGAVADPEFSVAIERLSSSVSVRQLQPRSVRDEVLGGVVGLMVGFVLAVLSTQTVMGTHARKPAGGGGSTE